MLAETSRLCVPTDVAGPTITSEGGDHDEPTHTTDRWGVLALMSVASAPALAAEAPEGQMTWALHFTLAPTLFEPAETAGLITPFMILYALHDALVKPMPGKTMAPSLAESWTRVAGRARLRVRAAQGRRSSTTASPSPPRT